MFDREDARCTETRGPLAVSDTPGPIRADAVVQAMRQELLFDLSGGYVYEVSLGLHTMA